MKKRRLTVVSPESQLTYNIKVTPHVGYCLSVSIPPLRPRQLIGHHRGVQDSLAQEYLRITGICLIRFLMMRYEFIHLQKHLTCIDVQKPAIGKM